jgi:hypothetical protein
MSLISALGGIAKAGSEKKSMALRVVWRGLIPEHDPRSGR